MAPDMTPTKPGPTLCLPPEDEGEGELRKRGKGGRDCRLSLGAG